MHLVIQKMTFILLAVLPLHHPKAVLSITLPLTFINMLIIPAVFAFPIQLVCLEKTLIVASIFESYRTIAILIAIEPLADVPLPVFSLLDTMALFYTA